MSTIVMSMNCGWSFHLGDIDLPPALSHGDVYNSCKAGAARGVPQSDFDTHAWEQVNLPHDHSVIRPFDDSFPVDWGCKPKAKAWYRKLFMLPPETEGKRLTLEFDGVAGNCTVYFNGSVLKRSFSGYVPFSVDITDRAVFGSPNLIAVFVDDNYEGWWYEGGGIYRDVRLVAKEPVSIPQYGVYVDPQLTDDGWSVNIEARVENISEKRTKVQIVTEINEDGGEVIAFSVSKPQEIPERRIVGFTQKLMVENPALWDTEHPALYTAVCRVFDADSNVLLDETKTRFGFRTVQVDPEKGFLLNGEPLKLFGTCNHQDHGGIGVAVPARVLEYRIKRLKEMGSNAYRCAHGMASTQLLEICDRLGMLVMDENRRFETSDEVLSQLRTMVLRDRNHPCVVMYSIFNEEPLQGTPQGQRMAKHMLSEIRKLDSTRPVTGAMHGGILDEHGAGSVMDICGVNYQIDSYEAFHKKYPEMPVFGSETTSAFSVRGCYETDMDSCMIASYDEVCADWGSTVSRTWEKALSHDYIAGAFMWTGFDYLGEPSPFASGAISSYFGMMDVCGFEKYGFLLSKAIFSKEPVCRMLPHWTHKLGEQVRVMSFTNCEEAELFINGRTQGRKPTSPTKQADWNVVFEPGEAEIRGYIRGKLAASEIVKTAGAPAKIVLLPYSDTLYDDGNDAMTVDVLITDENGTVVPNAANSVTITVSGGELLGFANGDPTCREEFTAHTHSVFHGMAQFIVAMKRGHAGDMAITACSPGLPAAQISVEAVKDSSALPVVETLREQYVQGWQIYHEVFSEMPDIKMLNTDGCDMNSWEAVAVENGTSPLFVDCKDRFAVFRTRIFLPEMNDTHVPQLHFHQLWGKCDIYLNGELHATSESEWAMEMDVPLNGITGELEITVICRSMNDYGGGVTASVVIRR